MANELTEQQLLEQNSLIKDYEEAAKDEFRKKAGTIKQGDFEESYSDFMFINSIFSNEKNLDQLMKEVYPQMRCKHTKQDEKKLLRYIGRVFLEQLIEYSIVAKEDSGKDNMDANCVNEGYRRYKQSHVPIRKSQSARRHLL